MRSRNVAPCERANSHASSAVRRLPTCSGPVGLGAKRPVGAGLRRAHADHARVGEAVSWISRYATKTRTAAAAHPSYRPGGCRATYPPVERGRLVQREPVTRSALVSNRRPFTTMNMWPLLA